MPFLIILLKFQLSTRKVIVNLPYAHKLYTARSPIYSHVSTTLQGLPIIRTFHKQDIAQRLLYHHQDVHSEVRNTLFLVIRTYTCIYIMHNYVNFMTVHFVHFEV